MKAHLIASEVPLIEGQTCTAACGAEIKRCIFVYMFNTDHATEFLAALSAVNTCSKCYRQPLDNRYVYGLVSADQIDRDKIQSEESAA